VGYFKHSLRTVSYRTLVGIVGISLALGSMLGTVTTHGLSINSARDCDANAVIRCGALSTEELRQKYNNDHSIRTIFNHFGISREDIRRLDATVVAGHVTRDGRVIVNGKTVATNAMTAGRQHMPGSTRVNRNGIQFYMRPPRVSFQSERLAAFIVMTNNSNSNTSANSNNTNSSSSVANQPENSSDTNTNTDTDSTVNSNDRTNNRQFAFAIIASCGNPVSARPVRRPVAQPKPQPAPTPPPAPTAPTQPQPKEKPQPSASATAEATANATVTINQPEQPAPTPAPQPQPQPQPVATAPPIPTEITPTQEKVEVETQELPKTGMTSESISKIAAIAGLTALGSSIIHILYARRKARKEKVTNFY